MAQDLKDEPFTIFAIALDEPEAARPWIDAAGASYPCLIDREHRVADLYNLVNVPQAVWIDEEGRIVRPGETAGSTDAFRSVNRQTGVVPPEVAAQRERVKRDYLDAVRDWVRKGKNSVHALRAEQASSSLQLPGDAVAEAHAHFRLGQHLRRAGREAEARGHFDRATELHPDSWAMWRQAAEKNERGLAAGPEFWARVDALGERPYYPAAKISGEQG